MTFLCLKTSLCNYVLNHVIKNFPIMRIRYLFFRLAKIKIGKKTIINMNQYILGSYGLNIGCGVHINQSCFLDARGGLNIGDNVSISHYCKLVTGSHDIQDADFPVKLKSIIIEDYAWLGIGCTVLQGVTIGKGAVVCAGAIVTKNVPSYTIVGGCPAKVIGHRNSDFNYKCQPEEIWV